MTLSLSDFSALVSTEVNLGSEYDASIPGKIRQAVRLFEKKLDFPYMRSKVAAVLPSNTTSLTLTGTNGIFSDASLLKKIKYVQFTQTDGRQYFPPRVDAEEVISVGSVQGSPTYPGGYWTDGLSLLNFDVSMAANANILLGAVLFSDWSKVTSTSSHWLFNNAEQALLCQVMMNLAPTMREPDLMAMYKSQLDDEWDWLAENVESFDWTNTSNYMEPDNA